MLDNHIQERRTLVHQLANTGQSAARIADALAAKGFVNPRTNRPYAASTIQTDLAVKSAKPVATGAPKRRRSVNRELIGRASYEYYSGLWKGRDSATVSMDGTRADYQFWDELRRGKAKGFELGGLFAQPIVQINASYALGKGFTATVSGKTTNPATGKQVAAGNRNNIKYTNDLLARVVQGNLSLLLRMTEDTYALADQFIVVNADGSFSIPSPDTVEVERDPLDYRKVIAYVICTKLDTVTIRDRYAIDKRTISVITAEKTVTKDYPNLIGRIPVVHFANDRSANELFGRPIYEALYHLFSRYDDLLTKALQGVEIMGNPIPTFEGMDDINGTIEALKTAGDESYMDIDGTIEDRDVIRFDRLPAIFVGKGGSFKFAAPTNGFTDDIRNMLKLLFLLMLDFSRVPEFLWGGAISSSKASAETQLPPFLQYIEGRRLQLEGVGADDLLNRQASGGLLELLDIWLRIRRLTDPKVVIAPVAIKWPDLTTYADEIRLKFLQFARKERLLSKADTLRESDLVDDPEQAIERAEEEQAKENAENASFQVNTLANQPDPADDADETDDDPVPDEEEAEEAA